MIPMRLAEIAAVTDGTVRDTDPDQVVDAPASVDSRTVPPGGLFVAVRGDNVDGHDFAPQAVAAGAVATLSSRPVGAPAVVVADPVLGLGVLARCVVDRLPRCHVVAVTGSQGKTGTKDLLAGVLERVGPTVAAAGSYNNELGVPLTATRADERTQHLLVEMGARGIGHLTRLCQITPPRVGLVLNVGVAHLGEFGSRRRIARAKGELVEALPPDGVAVLNADDPLVRAMAGRTAARVTTFGRTAHADVVFGEVTLDGDGRPSFQLDTALGTARVELGLVGAHQAANAAAAAATALACGIALDDIVAGLEAARPRSRWRMEVHERADGVTVVNDAYNANPDSMRAALETLAALGQVVPARRTYAVLGEMRELGDTSDREHAKVGRLAVRLGVRRLLVVGAQARPMYAAASENGAAATVSAVADGDEALDVLLREVRPGDVVLVKGSRATGLERVAEALLAAPTAGVADAARDGPA